MSEAKPSPLPNTQEEQIVEESWCPICGGNIFNHPGLKFCSPVVAAPNTLGTQEERIESLLKVVREYRYNTVHRHKLPNDTYRPPCDLCKQADEAMAAFLAAPKVVDSRYCKASPDGKCIATHDDTIDCCAPDCQVVDSKEISLSLDQIKYVSPEYTNALAEKGLVLGEGPNLPKVEEQNGEQSLPPRPQLQGGDYRPHYRKRETDAFIEALEAKIHSLTAENTKWLMKQAVHLFQIGLRIDDDAPKVAAWRNDRAEKAEAELDALREPSKGLDSLSTRALPTREAVENALVHDYPAKAIKSHLQQLTEGERRILFRAVLDSANCDSLSPKEPTAEHKWGGCQMGGDPANEGSYEWVRYCELCGMEDTCEDPLPPCPGRQLPADWWTDSSLETWFPLTAEELTRTKTNLAAAREEIASLLAKGSPSEGTGVDAIQLLREIRGEHDRLSVHPYCACWMCVRINDLSPPVAPPEKEVKK